MSEFSDRPFVAGSLTGVRSFKVDALGRLTGVSQPEVWRPGVNAARCVSTNAKSCRCHECAIYREQSSMRFAMQFVRTGVPMPMVMNPRHVSLHKHHVGELSCTCGYYAYFDRGANPHHREGRVQGLVRGYGRVTVGSRGFRASKAELVALIGRKRDPHWWERPTRLTWWNGCAAVVNLSIATQKALEGRRLIAAANLAVVLVILGVVVLNRRRMFHPSSAVLGRVAEHYGDVPVYRTLDAALKDFPLTPPPMPTRSPTRISGRDRP